MLGGRKTNSERSVQPLTPSEIGQAKVITHGRPWLIDDDPELRESLRVRPAECLGLVGVIRRASFPGDFSQAQQERYELAAKYVLAGGVISPDPERGIVGFVAREDFPQAFNSFYIELHERFVRWLIKQGVQSNAEVTSLTHVAGRGIDSDQTSLQSDVSEQSASEQVHGEPVHYPGTPVGRPSPPRLPNASDRQGVNTVPKSAPSQGRGPGKDGPIGGTGRGGNNVNISASDNSSVSVDMRQFSVTVREDARRDSARRDIGQSMRGLHLSRWFKEMSSVPNSTLDSFMPSLEEEPALARSLRLSKDLHQG